MLKVIIAGGRDFANYEILKYAVDKKLEGIKEDIEIVIGGQVSIDYETGEKFGADYLGRVYASERGYILKEFPADWNKYGKAAGPIRNQQMAAYADALIAFHDGKSKGTADMIKRATASNLKVQIVLYQQPI